MASSGFDGVDVAWQASTPKERIASRIAVISDPFRAAVHDEAQVLRSQLVHSRSPRAQPAFLDLAQALARGPVEFLGVGNPSRSPRADLHDDRQQRDGALGERADRLVLAQRT